MIIETTISGLKIGLYPNADRAVAMESFFVDKYSPDRLNHNLSHSGSVLALGQHLLLPIGIDIEVGPVPDGYISVAKEFFTRKEFIALGNISGNDQADSFLSLWTAKEAYCKLNRSNLSDCLPGPDLTKWIEQGCCGNFLYIYKRKKMTLVFKTGIVDGERYFLSVAL